MTVGDLVLVVLEYYQTHHRELPWRVINSECGINPYHVLVSEIMLQQTQATRVIPKFNDFITRFPTIESLAEASLADVVRLWSGLGYNRRAKYVQQIAQLICQLYGGQVPASVDTLQTLPGIGANTAAAIYVYSFNRPAVFIETNIRTVFIHHLFADTDRVSDSEILPLLTESLQHPFVSRDPRSWYWALMDYGVFLKANVGNASRRSKHHVVQSKFEGSRRQARGAILRALTKKDCSRNQLKTATNRYTGFESVLEDLMREGLIIQINDKFSLAESGILTE